MKKYLLLITFIVTLKFSSTFGQQVAENNSGKSKIGFRTGFNLSRWVGEGSAYARVKSGYHAGFFMKRKISEKYLLQPEVLFSLRGNASAFETGSGEIIQRQALYCIDVPLLFGVLITDGLYFNVGLQPSILVAAKFRRDYPDGTTFISNSTEGFRKFNLDLLAGLEVEMGSQFSLGTRLGYGITGVTTNKNSGLHQVFLQLTVGYKF
jgi:hypothetical protein